MQPHLGLSLSAGMVFLDPSSRALLVHQNYGRRAWSLPGGMPDAGESPHKAAMREVREEIGVNAHLAHLIGVYYLVGENPGIGFAFLGYLTPEARPHVSDDAELDDIGWFALDDLPQPVRTSLPRVLADALAGLCGVFATMDG